MRQAESDAWYRRARLVLGTRLTLSERGFLLMPSPTALDSASSVARAACRRLPIVAAAFASLLVASALALAWFARLP